MTPTKSVASFSDTHNEVLLLLVLDIVWHKTKLIMSNNLYILFFVVGGVTIKKYCTQL